MAANIHPGEHNPVELPGTTPVYEVPMAEGGKQVDPYNNLTLSYVADAAQWPGVFQPVKEHHVDERNGFNVPPNDAYMKASQLDVTVGGMPGAVNRLPYSQGVVDTNMVENHELTGRQIRLRRQPENQWGPVAGGRGAQPDFHGAIAQQGLPDLPDWVSQSGIAEVI